MAKLRGGGGLSSFKMFNRGVIQSLNIKLRYVLSILLSNILS